MLLKNLYTTRSFRLGVFVLAVVLCQFAYTYVIEQQEYELRQKLELEGLENTLILAGELGNVERELMGIVSFFHASETVTRSGFKTYVTPLFEHHEFIDSLMWIPRVSHSHRHALESIVQEDGYDDFKFSVFDDNYSLVPAPDKDEYFPIIYMEPRSGIDALLGLDVRALPTLFGLMNEVPASGKPIVTYTQYWFKYDEEKYWFKYAEEKTALIFAPFYSSKEIPKTIEDRKRQFRGAVVGAYRMGDMIGQMVNPYMGDDISLAVFDEDYKEKLTGKALTKFEGFDADPKNKLFGEIHEDAVMEYQSLLRFFGRRLGLIWQVQRASR